MVAKRKIHAQPSYESPTSMEMSWDVALYVLRPDELEQLKRYVVAYIAKYGNEEEAPTQESEGVS